MTKAICEDCGSLVDAEITHNGVCEVGHYVHCGWGHMLSPSDLISDAAADRIEELEAKLAKLARAAKPFAAIKIKDGRSQPGEIGRTDVTNLRAALAELKGEDRG
jgi:hypothetical protein